MLWHTNKCTHIHKNVVHDELNENNKKKVKEWDWNNIKSNIKKNCESSSN